MAVPSSQNSAAGAIEHAAGAAAEDDARVALRQATLKLAEARGPLRREDPERALGYWKGLVNARWSLLDRFEARGERYVVAVENEPEPLGAEKLSLRERQVVAFACSGHENKLIAYELGISHATVRVLVARAAAKLGAHSRAELVHRFAAQGERAQRNPR